MAAKGPKVETAAFRAQAQRRLLKEIRKGPTATRPTTTGIRNFGAVVRAIDRAPIGVLRGLAADVGNESTVAQRYAKAILGVREATARTSKNTTQTQAQSKNKPKHK